jgi:hypothetical protein
MTRDFQSAYLSLTFQKREINRNEETFLFVDLACNQWKLLLFSSLCRMSGQRSQQLHYVKDSLSQSYIQYMYSVRRTEYILSQVLIFLRIPWAESRNRIRTMYVT